MVVLALHGADRPAAHRAEASDRIGHISQISILARRNGSRAQRTRSNIVAALHNNKLHGGLMTR
jgi:hypothetical protein